MSYPTNLKYSKDHEWVRVEGDIAYVGITGFAAGELGDIVYVEVETVGQSLSAHSVFGTVEAVKTVSDLFMPVSGTIEAFNDDLNNAPDVVNSHPYEGGWMIKVRMSNPAELDELMDAAAYSAMVGA